MKTLKTRHTLLLLALIVSLSGCAGRRAVTPGGAPAQPATALDVLQQRDPQVAWVAASEVRADFDHDGVVDYALRGLHKDRVIVGIVQGPPARKSRIWILSFVYGKKTQDSLCSADAKIESEDLDDSATAGAKRAGTKSPKGGKGLNLYDDRCDSFHIYWNAATGKFAWWRL